MRTVVLAVGVTAILGAQVEAQPGGVYEPDPYYEPEGVIDNGVFGRWTVVVLLAVGGVLALFISYVKWLIEHDFDADRTLNAFGWVIWFTILWLATR